MGLLIQEDRSAIWKNNSASRLNAECLKALDYQYNKGLPRPPTREMDRGIITEEMAVAKHFGKDIAVVGEEKLQQLLRERPERSEHLEWYREQWPRWIAGVETYDSGYALWPVDPIQRKVTLTIEGTTPALIGYIDLVIDGQGKPIVADIKSKGQLSWGISQAWRRQLTIYFLTANLLLRAIFLLVRQCARRFPFFVTCLQSGFAIHDFLGNLTHFDLRFSTLSLYTLVLSFFFKDGATDSSGPNLLF